MAKKSKRKIKFTIIKDEFGVECSAILIGGTVYGYFYSQYSALWSVKKLMARNVVSRTEKKKLDQAIKASSLRADVPAEELFGQLEYLTELVIDLLKGEDEYREGEDAIELSVGELCRRHVKCDALFRSPLEMGHNLSRLQGATITIDADDE